MDDSVTFAETISSLDTEGGGGEPAFFDPLTRLYNRVRNLKILSACVGVVALGCSAFCLTCQLLWDKDPCPSVFYFNLISNWVPIIADAVVISAGLYSIWKLFVVCFPKREQDPRDHLYDARTQLKNDACGHEIVCYGLITVVVINLFRIIMGSQIGFLAFVASLSGACLVGQMVLALALAIIYNRIAALLDETRQSVPQSSIRL